jgi:hypothetical protein
MNTDIFSAFSRELAKYAAMPSQNEAPPPELSSEDPEQKKKSLLRKAALPALGVGAGALGIRQLALKGPKYLRFLGRSGKSIGNVAKEVGQASTTPVASLKKGWRELGAFSGSEKRVNEIKDVLNDAITSGKKYSLDVIDKPDAALRRSGIGSVGTRYHGRLNNEQVQKALKNVLHRRTSGEYVLSRTATPEQIEKAYKTLQKLKTRESSGFFEQAGDVASRGLSAVTRNMPGEKVVVPGLMGVSAYGDLSQKTDPRTGRERGIGERVGRAGAGIFTGLAFNPIFAKQVGVLPGMVGQLGADIAGAQIGGLAGRGVDLGIKKFKTKESPTTPPVSM